MMRKILMIEDDVVVSTVYRTKFIAAGHQVQVAADGEEGLALAQTFQPEYIVLDLGLPKLDGVEVIKQLRAMPGSKNVPLLVLTNAYLADRIKEAWAAGATKCLPKAECTPKTLLDIIEKITLTGPAIAPLTPPTQEPAALPYATIAFPAGAKLIKAINTADTFLAQGPTAIAKLRQLVLDLSRSQRPETTIHYCSELYTLSRSLAAQAALAELTRFARMASALEAFSRELLERPELLTSSSQRTMGQAIDFLDELLRKKGGEDGLVSVEGVLVVDDEPLSRRAVVKALERVGIGCFDIEDPQAALAMLSGTQFDLMLLDINMPGMNGFDLCRNIRAIPQYKTTPVIFVSGQSDFQSRAQSVLSGGNDLIAKPFHFLELGIKALIHLWRPQLNRAS